MNANPTELSLAFASGVAIPESSAGEYFPAQTVKWPSDDLMQRASQNAALHATYCVQRDRVAHAHAALLHAEWVTALAKDHAEAAAESRRNALRADLAAQKVRLAQLTNEREELERHAARALAAKGVCALPTADAIERALSGLPDPELMIAGKTGVAICIASPGFFAKPIRALITTAIGATLGVALDSLFDHVGGGKDQAVLATCVIAGILMAGLLGQLSNGIGKALGQAFASQSDCHAPPSISTDLMKRLCATLVTAIAIGCCSVIAVESAAFSHSGKPSVGTAPYKWPTPVLILVDAITVLLFVCLEMNAGVSQSRRDLVTAWLRFKAASERDKHCEQARYAGMQLDRVRSSIDEVKGSIAEIDRLIGEIRPIMPAEILAMMKEVRQTYSGTNQEATRIEREILTLNRRTAEGEADACSRFRARMRGWCGHRSRRGIAAV